MSFNYAICCLSITGIYECICCSLFIKSLIKENITNKKKTKNNKKYEKINSNIEIEENEHLLMKKPNIGIKPDIGFEKDNEISITYDNYKITDFSIKSSLETLYE
jgi:hypothetical protein